MYRVPSVLAAMLTVLLTWRLGLKMFDPRAAWLAAALLAVCPMVVWDAHQARADQLLLAMTTATMMCLWCVWHESKGATTRRRFWAARGAAVAAQADLPPSTTRVAKADAGGGSRLASAPTSRLGWVLAFWFFLALGIMTKGPITPLIAGLTVVALCMVSRDWSLVRRLKPWWGLVIVAAIVGPWVYLVGQAVGWEKYLGIVYDETIGRSAGAKEGHWGPPGYHIVLLGVLFWPGSLLTAAAIGRAWRRGLKRNTENAASTENTEVGVGGGRGERVGRIFSLRRSVASSLRRLLTSRPGRSAELFCLAWMLPSWIVFELIGTKLPHYTMPLYPAVALMSARALFGARAMFMPALSEKRRAMFRSLVKQTSVHCPRCRYSLDGMSDPRCPECGLVMSTHDDGTLAAGIQHDKSQRPGSGIWRMIGIGLGVVAPIVLFLWSASTEDSFPIAWRPELLIPALFAIVASAAFLHLAVEALRKGAVLRCTSLAVTMSVTSIIVMMQFMLPKADQIWVSRDLVRDLKAANWNYGSQTAGFGYVEDSLVFLTRGAFKRMSSAPLAGEWFRAGGGKFLVVEERSLITLGSATYHIGDLASWQTVQSTRGLNYANGSQVRLYIWIMK